MKNQVKKFSQYIKESDEFRMERSETPESVGDLIDYYVKSNHPNGFVLVCIDLQSPARDLMNGGLKIMIEPSEEEIEETVDSGYYECDLYENGEKLHNWY